MDSGQWSMIICGDYYSGNNHSGDIYNHIIIIILLYISGDIIIYDHILIVNSGQ